MKTGPRTEGPSKLKITYTSVVSANLRGRIREVSHFETVETERGKGHGTRLMRKVCAEADRNQVVLMLTPGTEKLGEWYAAFGFRTIQDDPQLMARMPQQ